MGEAHQLRHFGIVEVLQRNGVEFHLDACRLCGIEPLHHPVDIPPAGDMAEFMAVERIEGYIDAAHAAIGEFGCEFRQL